MIAVLSCWPALPAALPGARIGALLGVASLALACDRSTAAVASGFDEARAWRDLESIVALGPRTPGSEAIERLRTMLERELRAAGLEPVRETFEVPFPAGFRPKEPGESFSMANVYADLPAEAPDAETVILCTHFDTKYGIEGFLGANDGGAGTAVLLELARVLAKAGPRPVRYRFLFLDGEEALRHDWEGKDNTYGSRHHAAGLVARKEAGRVRCCVLLDLVGDRDLRFLRESYSDRRLNEIFVTAATEAGFGAHVDGPRLEARDDHLSFMAVGIPSIDLIDFDYGPDNDWWHSAEDTLDKCSARSLGITGRIVLAALPKVERDFRR